MALGMAMLAGQLVHHVGGNISTTIRCIAMDFFPDMQGLQWENPTDFADRLTFSLAQLQGKSINLCCDIFQHLPNGLAKRLVHTTIVPRGCILMTLPSSDFSSSTTTRLSFYFFIEMSQQPLEYSKWTREQCHHPVDVSKSEMQRPSLV